MNDYGLSHASGNIYVCTPIYSATRSEFPILPSVIEPNVLFTDQPYFSFSQYYSLLSHTFEPVKSKVNQVYTILTVMK
jgi:hypothetical protein